jgi:hypothetical protein
MRWSAKKGAMLEGLVRVLLLEEFFVGLVDAGVDLFESKGVVVVICLKKLKVLKYNKN